MMDVESTEFSEATREYQKAMEQKVVQLGAKGEAARPVRSQDEGEGPAHGWK